VLLDSRFDLVDKIKQTVFRDARYKGTDIGAATIFQDDVRISTTVTGSDGSRAIGTRVTQPVYEQVVGAGVPWVGHSDAVDHTYISVYEPIRNINDSIVGMLAVGLLEDPYADLQARTSLLFLGITLAGALLAITLSYFIARRVAGPVRQLVGASRELARGNLDVTVSEQSVGELAELAHAFNSMSSALHARDEKLKEFTKKKIMESERLAVIGQLAADVAHELNNPLQGIVTYAHLLMESPTSSTSKASVEKIANQANRCTKIIRGLLDFSRPRAPQKKLANINALLDESLSLVENQALFHNIDIVKEWDASIPEIVVDPSQIQQVCMNLIFNAAEAMNGSGRLHISTSINGHGMIEVAFTDSGHGIAPDNLERVFDPFFTTKEVGHGTGLGLAISYGIVREHDGTITVESRVGEGTTFTVRIPARTEEDV
jgi:two-component system NtrC family sensor kinase